MKRLALLVVAACGADVPANPTYFSDVQAIVRANCVRCHGAEPSQPKIARFRLDRYVKNDTATFDLYDYSMGADSALLRVAVDQETPAMPPDYALTDRQREILERWVAQGSPKGTRENHMPQMDLIAPLGATTADQTLDMTFRAWDADLDGLFVQLWAHDIANNEDIPLGMQTGGGEHDLAIDTGTLASKRDFEIYAVLDDGYFDDPEQNKVRTPLLPNVYVDHGIRGTAPTVKLITPNGGDTLFGSVSITWSATDPDTDPTNGTPDVLKISINLVRFDASGAEVSVEPIANALANTGSYVWTIPATVATTDASGAPIPYKIRVVAVDTLGVPNNIRSDDSDYILYLAQSVTTTYTWADIQPLTTKYCADCHSDPARTVAIDYFCLLEYEKGEAVPPCAAGDVGAYEQRSLVYQRTVTLKNMPPATAPQPTQAERDKIANWILGGAPYGSGPADAHPSLVWMAPGNTVLDASTTGMATLMWTDADAEALVADRIEYAKVNGPPGCNLSTGCGSMIIPTWNLVTMSSVSGVSAAQSYSWSRPAEGAGCYCVRGIVTDSAMQSTTVIANKPVRF